MPDDQGCTKVVQFEQEAQITNVHPSNAGRLG